MKYSVLIVDDSIMMRNFLKEMINSIEEFTVVGVASDAFEARERIKELEPDLVTIDINMPKMDGVTFLKNLMRLHPMPAIVISSISEKQKDVFEDGAIGFVQKKGDSESSDLFFERLKDTLLKYEFLLERYKEKKPKIEESKSAVSQAEEKFHPDVLISKAPYPFRGKKIVAIGSSTGGIEALISIFEKLPPNLPPIVIAQHIPYGFSNSFAQRLNAISKVSVKEAEDGDLLQSGCAYIAQGNKHLIVELLQNKNYIARISTGTKISRHRPSVDVLFRSVNNSAGSGAMGVMLTGMGDDGAIGIKELFDNGAYTIAQDESTSTVFGMPKKAIEAGAAKEVVPLGKIAEKIISYSL